MASATEELLATRSERPLVVGICGAQGSGKSTLAAALAERLDRDGHPCAILSIDDLYLTRKERLQLARDVHPLLETRGPPGTHDADLGRSIIAALRRGEACALPRFDKAHDDRRARGEWPEAPRGCAVLLVEGWCVGARPQSVAALQKPVNPLEAVEDPRGIWRTYVNDALAGAYRLLFDEIDFLVFLAAPDFEVVVDWRAQQEEELRNRMGGKGDHLMNRGQIARFVQHYERLSRHMLNEMPGRADLTVFLDAWRRPIALHYR